MSDAPKTPTPTPLPRAAKPSVVPSGSASKKWDTIQLGIRLGCVVLLTASVVGFFCLSGKAITVEQIGLIIVAGGALAGISIARPGGGTGATLIGGSLMLLTLTACGCGGAILPDPTPNDGVGPCVVEGAIVDSLGDAVEAVDQVVPDDAPKAADALTYARAGVTEGRAAIEACEALTSEGRSGLSAVLPWIRVAMDVARGLLAILGAAGVDMPDSLEDVLRSLGLVKAEGYVPEYIDVAKGPVTT